jgi:hypothetical protein
MENSTFQIFRYSIKHLPKLISFLLLLIFFSETKATGTLGADISWKSVNEGEYKIHFRVFRSCYTSTFDTSMKLSVRCLETNAVARIDFDSSSFITTIGKTECSDTFSCYLQNYFHSFESFLDFNNDSFLLAQIANGGCRFEIEMTTNWSFNHFFNPPFRSNIYVSSMLNICNLKNSKYPIDNSPQFSFNPNHILGPHQPAFWSPGVYDMDKDSLSFSLINPKGAHNISYNYNHSNGWPFRAYCRRYDDQNWCVSRPERNPPEGFYFDSKTGNMVFQPVDAFERNQVVLKVDQFRLDSSGKHMLHLGYVTQEFQINVRHHVDNNPPALKIEDLKQYCEGEKICLNVNVLDEEYEDQHGKQDWKDTLELKWNHSIPGATWEMDTVTTFFSENGKNYAQIKGELCWQTESGDASFDPYFVTFYAKDKACQFNSIAKKTFLIYVNPNMKAESERYFAQDSFGNLYVEHIATGKDTLFNRYNQYDFTWQIKDLSENKVITTSKKQKDTFGFLKAGAYEVLSSVSYADKNCSEFFYDTIYISCDLAELPLIKTPEIPDICVGDSFCFNIEVTVDLNQVSNPTPATHSIDVFWDHSVAGAIWTLDSNMIITDSSGTYAYRKAEFCLHTDVNDTILNKSFKVMARNSTCSYYDSITKVIDFNIHTFPSAITHFAQDSTGVLYFGSIPEKSQTYTHLWEIRDSTNSGTPYYTSQNEIDSFSLPYSGTFVVTYEITNQANCTASYLDTITICTDNNAPKIEDIFVIPVCVGDTLCFDVEVYDEQSSSQSWSDTIEMDWDRSIVNAVWTVDSPAFVTFNNIDYAYRKATFCWATQPEDGSFVPYVVHVFASDMACPAKAVSIKAVEFYVYPHPEAQRLYSQDNLGLLSFESVPGNSSNAVHEWEIRDSTNSGTPIHTSNEIKDTFTFQLAGTYVMTYTITDTLTGCASIFQDTMTIIIDHNQSANWIQTGQFKIYPNPAFDQVYVESQSHIMQHLKVYDVTGKVILDKAVSEKSIVVDTRIWVAGTYIFEIKSNEQIFRMKQLIVK